MRKRHLCEVIHKNKKTDIINKRLYDDNHLETELCIAVHKFKNLYPTLDFDAIDFIYKRSD